MPEDPITHKSEGISNQYLIQGVASVGIGLICFTISPYLALPLIFVGILYIIVNTDLDI
jgi:hypothetical protein